MSTVREGSVALKLEDGCSVHARVHQQAQETGRPRCVLLHGNPASLSCWAPVIELVQDAADVAAFDFPGFGQSPRPKDAAEDLSLNALASTVIAVADALNWREPVFLVGHSHGGGVAQTVAAQYPERVAGLVLLGSLGAPIQESYRLLNRPVTRLSLMSARGLLRTGALPWLTRRVLAGVMRNSYYPEAVPTWALEQQLALFGEHPEILQSMVDVARGRPCEQLYDSATGIQCPTLFLHGLDDALVAPRHARAIHDRILESGGRSTFVPLAGIGHMLPELHAPTVAQALLDFVRTASTQP